MLLPAFQWKRLSKPRLYQYKVVSGLDIEIENRDFFIFYGILDGTYGVCTGAGTGDSILCGRRSIPIYLQRENLLFHKGETSPVSITM